MSREIKKNASAAQKRRAKMDQTNEYNREHYRMFGVRYHRTREKKIIDYIEKQGSFKAYVTQLIIEDMERKKLEKLTKKKR